MFFSPMRLQAPQRQVTSVLFTGFQHGAWYILDRYSMCLLQEEVSPDIFIKASFLPVSC